MVALNHAVAVAMAEGVAAAGPGWPSSPRPRIAEHPRYLAVSAHLLEMAGEHEAARTAYAAAAREPEHPAAALPERPAARLARNAEARTGPPR